MAYTWNQEEMIDGARMLTFGWDRDPDTDRSVPVVTNLDTTAIAHQSKSADDIIRSATFPAAHAPSPDDTLRSEGDRWPYSLAVLGTVGSWWHCLHCYNRHPTTTYLLLFLPSNCPKSLTASLLLSELTVFSLYSICLYVLLAQSRSTV